MKVFSLIVIILSSSWHVYGETLDVEYASFYSHVKKLDDEETNALRFAFGFRHVIQQRLCHIEDAKIVTEKQVIPLNIENHQRFTVPTDKVLKMAKALVVIELADQANQCDMSVQLETLPGLLKLNYGHAELVRLLTQYQVFFDNMGGFLSFLMPSAEGLLVQFSGNPELPEKLAELKDSNGHLVLGADWFEGKQDLELNTIPLRITALTKK